MPLTRKIDSAFKKKEYNVMQNLLANMGKYMIADLIGLLSVFTIMVVVTFM